MKRIFFRALGFFCLPVFGVGLLQCVGAEPALTFPDGGDAMVSGEGGESDIFNDVTPDRTKVHEAGTDGTEDVEADVATACVSGMPCVPAACATGTTECSDSGTTCVPAGTSAN